LTDGLELMSDVTQVLLQIEAGDPSAPNQLLPLIDELRKLATRRLAQEKPGQTLQATSLVHEAFIRLDGSSKPTSWSGRNHFLEPRPRRCAESWWKKPDGKRKRRLKRGGDLQRIHFDEAEITLNGPAQGNQRSPAASVAVSSEA
jgi:hypothetical protein